MDSTDSEEVSSATMNTFCSTLTPSIIIQKLQEYDQIAGEDMSMTDYMVWLTFSGTIFTPAEVDQNLYTVDNIRWNWARDIPCSKVLRKQTDNVNKLVGDDERFWRWADPWELTIGIYSTTTLTFV